jgi:uncharacterized protein YggE
MMLRQGRKGKAMNKRVWLLVLAVASLVSLSCQVEKRTMSVTGTGKVSFVPDAVSFSVTIRNLSPTLEEAAGQTKKTVADILDLSRKYGIDEKDLTTSYIRTDKEYTNQNGNEAPKFIGYSSTQSTAITYRDLSKFEAFSRDLLQLKITSMDDMAFSRSNYAEVASQADMLALDDARQAAQKMADKMKVQLGEVLFISNTGENPPAEYAGAYETRSFAKNSGGGIVLSPGQLSVAKSVQVVFKIK